MGKQIIGIVGAGMAGLLAGNLLLRERVPFAIFEKQASLPNNHSALLRFRSPIVGEMTGIPFRKVTVVKWTKPHRNPIADLLSYSAKCSGVFRSDRSLPTLIVSGERFIAPPDFIGFLAEPIASAIRFNSPDVIYAERIAFDTSPIISTIPMPTLMELLNYPAERPVFTYTHGINISIRLFPGTIDAYATIYLPDPDFPVNRVSITGTDIIAEISLPNSHRIDEGRIERIFEDFKANSYIERAVLDLFGIDPKMVASVKYARQKYAKILPIGEEERKAFMLWASSVHNIFSLGRFATWRPGLLLDDLVHDVRKINGWIANGSYDLMRTHHNHR